MLYQVIKIVTYLKRIKKFDYRTTVYKERCLYSWLACGRQIEFPFEVSELAFLVDSCVQ